MTSATDNRTTKLLPCPFCGGEAHMSASSDGYGVECWNRRCIDMQMEQIPTEAEAIDAWNTRHVETCRSTTPDNAWCFSCSSCGRSFPRNELLKAHNHGEINYCPNCGAKVIQGVDNAD